MVRKHGSLVHDEEINEAGWIAARGAGVGAAKWGIFSAVAAGLGLAFSPLYRGLTFQFKVYDPTDKRFFMGLADWKPISGICSFLQMSGMTAGSMIEADRRLRAHEVAVRNQRKIARDAEVWRRYEEDYVDKAADARMRESK